jgi:hypothetical protein
MDLARVKRHAYLAPVLMAALAIAQGCVGDIGAGAAGAVLGQPQSCGGDVVPVTALAMRRLTPDQYLNTVRDLLGDPDFIVELEEPEGDTITERAVRQFRDAAEIAFDRRDLWTVDVFGCDITGSANPTCVDEFISDFGARAFRRTLDDEERTWLMGIYDETIAVATFEETMGVLVQIMLQAPAMLYMYEGGTDGDETMRPLTNFEIASRLSYFVWNTMPDDTLFEAASRGDLSGPEGLRAEAERLLADPRAENNIQRFFSQWLQLDGGQLHHALEDTDKDPTLYPTYDDALRSAMRTETEAFVRRTFFDEGGSFEKLFTGNYAYVNGPLADVYGVAGPNDPDTYEWVELDAQQRGGIVTRAAFLTVLSTANVTAPIRRGVWVLEEALCNGVGAPPADVDDSPVEGGQVENENGEVELLTVREDVDARTSGAECQTCHGSINPVGFSFENYDAIGRWQTEEVTSGLPVDATGELKGSDVDGELENALELRELLAISESVRESFDTRWTSSAIGADDVDTCSQEHIAATFAETGDMRQLLVAIIESNAFRFINTAEDTP